MRQLESRAAAARRARSEFDGYADSILLNEREAGAVSGVGHNTLKFWRLTGSAKGPRAVYLYGMVRYEAGEIPRWRTETQARPVDDVQPGAVARQEASRLDAKEAAQ
jgi:hypothetical protein